MHKLTVSLQHRGRTDTELMADSIRYLAVHAAQTAKAGHSGMPMDMAAAMTGMHCIEE